MYNTLFFDVELEKHDFTIYKQEVTAIFTETVLKTAFKKEIFPSGAKPEYICRRAAHVQVTQCLQVYLVWTGELYFKKINILWCAEFG